MLLAGLLIYRKEIVQKEFFLRRISLLSLHLYAVICILAKIKAAMSQGKNVAEDMDMLAYFLEEARQSRRDNKHFFPSKKERLHRKIMKNL